MNHKKLPCSNKGSRNAWMTTFFWSSWLREPTSNMVLQKRHILLFVDNATSHRMNAELSNTKVVFIPPNCTSVLQPMDQGVVWSFKYIFRRMLLSFIVDSIDEMNQKHLMSNFDLLKANAFHQVCLVLLSMCLERPNSLLGLVQTRLCPCPR